MIAPKTAAPRLCPRKRANIAPPVMTPRWDHVTVDCNPTSRGAVIRPIPAPMRRLPSTACQIEASSVMRTKTMPEAMAKPAPTTAVSRNPIRR